MRTSKNAVPGFFLHGKAKTRFSLSFIFNHLSRSKMAVRPCALMWVEIDAVFSLLSYPGPCGLLRTILGPAPGGRPLGDSFRSWGTGLARPGLVVRCFNLLPAV